MARYIDAEKLLIALDEKQRHLLSTYATGRMFFALDNEIIREQPTADVQEVRHGEWIEIVKDIGRGRYITNYQCSLCGVYIAQRTNGCPNCIAKMDGERRTDNDV